MQKLYENFCFEPRAPSDGLNSKENMIFKLIGL